MFQTPPDERSLRIATVNEQAAIEDSLLQLSKAAAIFIVPTPLTPLYIASEAVYCDTITGLYKVNEPTAIPSGLIPDEKLTDPVQLSTVLRRVKTLHVLLERQVPIIVICENICRAKTNEPNALVDDTILQQNLARYSISITPTSAIPSTMCAANYQLGEDRMVSISANQIQQEAQVNWGVTHQTTAYLNQLDEYLQSHSLPSALELMRGGPDLLKSLERR